MNLTSFPVGPLIFSTGGFIFFLGVIVATWMLDALCTKKGLSISFLNEHIWIFIITSFVVGRLAYVNSGHTLKTRSSSLRS